MTLKSETPISQLPEAVGWKNTWPFSEEEVSRYEDRGPSWYCNDTKCAEHPGTDFDAPMYCVAEQHHENHAVDTPPPSPLLDPAELVQATAENDIDDGLLLSEDFFRNWEPEQEQILKRAWDLRSTEWCERATPEEFLNKCAAGNHSPRWDPATITIPVEERNFLGVGIKTVGTEAGQAAAQDPILPCHNLMDGANQFVQASLCSLNELVATGAFLVTAPFKIENGPGSPCGVIALVPA